MTSGLNSQGGRSYDRRNVNTLGFVVAFSKPEVWQDPHSSDGQMPSQASTVILGKAERMPKEKVVPESYFGSSHPLITRLHAPASEWTSSWSAVSPIGFGQTITCGWAPSSCGFTITQPFFRDFG